MSQENQDIVAQIGALLVGKVRAKKKLPPPQVVHSEDVRRIELPPSLSFREAAEYCKAKADEQEALTTFPYVPPAGCMPWVGFYAAQKMIDRSYSGTYEGGETSIQGPRGPVTVKAKNPQPSGHPVRDAWGVWTVHGLGEIALGVQVAEDQSGFYFKATVHAPRFFRPKVELFFEELGAEIAKRELYSGAALALMPEAESGQLNTFVPPRMIDIGHEKPGDVILARDVQAQVAAELFLPITDSQALSLAGLPTRRGILLAGRPGTGKTMSARIASRLALDRGWTVFYLADARGLEGALKLAQAHQPAVLVAEDIDRHLAGERTALTDRILNALDGLDRSARVVFVATSNDPDSLPAPLLRPGRLDSLIVYEAPDAQAGEKLLRRYLGQACPAELPPEVGSTLAGLLSASVREVASRSILHSRARFSAELFLDGKPVSVNPVVESQDIVTAAHAVWTQQRRLEKAEQPVEPSLPTIPIRIIRGDVPKLSRDNGLGG